MWMSGLRLRAGSLRLIFLRWVCLLACLLPGRVMAGKVFETAFGQDPHVASRAGAPPLAAVIGAVQELGPAMGVLVAGGLVFLVLDQLLSATCLTLCDPNRGDAKLSVWNATWRFGMQHLLPLLRIAVAGAVGLAVVAFAVGKLLHAWDVSLEAAGASGLYRVRGLVIARLVLLALGFAMVGAVTYWARTLTVADERRRSRRALVDACKVIWRAPLSAGLLFVGLTAGYSLATAWVLTELLPVTGDNTAGFFVWSGLMLLQCVLWHWTWHTARLLYADPLFVGIAGRGDENFALTDWLRGLVRGIRS